MKETYLIVGLGNPEGKYFRTYHNVGFVCADKVGQSQGLTFKKKGNQLIADFTTPNAKIYILKPLTYMNLSGQAVLAVVRKYKIAPANVIIFVDDLYIDKGNIRIARGGSSAGHNGIRSINDLLQSTEYIKIRVGIKPQKEIKGATANYVLSNIDEESKILIDSAIDRAVSASAELVGGVDLARVQNVYNVVNNVSAKN